MCEKHIFVDGACKSSEKKSPGGEPGTVRAVTGCNPRPEHTAGAGVESPTVPPETEDGLPRGVLARAPSRLRPSGHAKGSPSFMGDNAHGGRGVFGRNPPPPTVRTWVSTQRRDV